MNAGILCGKSEELIRISEFVATMHATKNVFYIKNEISTLLKTEINSNSLKPYSSYAYVQLPVRFYNLSTFGLLVYAYSYQNYASPKDYKRL